MTPEAQRIAIAEACGTRFENDPLQDLNAMHEAEKVLTIEQLRRMTVEIHDIMTRDPKQDWIPVHHCTAAQRAEAFLRTLGKWETDASNLSTVESNTAQHLT